MTATIHYINENQPHKAVTVECRACKRRWVAVAHVDTVVFECPSCGQMGGFEPSED